MKAIVINIGRLFFLWLLIFALNVKAQEKEPVYRLNAFAGIAYSRYLTSIDELNINKNGYSGTIRFMWQPEYLLSIGIETGYLHFYSSESAISTTGGGSTTLKASLAGTPIMPVFGMKLAEGVYLSGGSGAVILFSNSESFGEKNVNTIWSPAYMVSFIYSYPVAERMSLGGELKAYYMGKTKDACITLGFSLAYSVLEW